MPYSDQFSLGMRNRLGDWNTSASVTRILSKDGFVFTLGNRYPNGDFWQNRAQPWGNSPPGLAGVLLVGDNGIETKSTQVLLSADKPFTEESRWGATFSYTFTDAEHNRDINEHYSFDQSSINEYPFITVERRGQTSRRRDRLVRGALGIHARGQAHLVDADSAQRQLVLCRAGVFPNGAPLHRVRVRRRTATGYQSLDLQITKNFEIGDIGIHVPAIRRPQRDQRGQPRRLTST